MLAELKRLLLLKMRRDRRYKAKDGLCVAYEQSMSMNQVDTISMGGLSFYYVDRGRKIETGSYQLSIINRNRVYLRNVPFETISDQASGEIPLKQKRVKRQSVRFQNLTRRQKKRLKAIISHLTE
jgi:hypothetical protein